MVGGNQEGEETLRGQKSIHQIILKMKEDSNYFLEQHQRKDANFSIEKEENLLSPDEREIRWHIHMIDAMELVISENETLKRKIIHLEEENKNAIAARAVITDEIGSLNANLDMQTSAFVTHTDETNEEISNIKYLIDSGECQGVLSQNITQIKVRPPTFSDGENDRPMHFLSELKNYI